MDEDTIKFLRALCSKVKEVITLCETHLTEQSLRRNKPHIPGMNPIEIRVPAESGNRLIRACDWPKFHPWPKISGLRHILYHDWLNGSDYFKKKVGRSVLICEKSFFEWVNMSEEERLKNSLAMQTYKARFNRIGNRRLK